MIVILICAFVFADVLMKTITVLELRKTICKTLFRVSSLFIWMIDWSTIEFVTYKAFLKTTILKFIIRFITKFISIKFNSTIEWFISTIILASSILFISEIVILDFVVLMILILKILLLSEDFSNDFVIDDAWLQNIHQDDNVHWRVD
jgi:hypothetical protein